MDNKTVDKIMVAKDFIGFPESINKECAEGEFHKMITSHNSDIPIENVNFRDYPDTRTKS